MQNVKQKEETTYFLENDTLVVYPGEGAGSPQCRRD